MTIENSSGTLPLNMASENTLLASPTSCQAFTPKESLEEWFKAQQDDAKVFAAKLLANGIVNEEKRDKEGENVPPQGVVGGGNFNGWLTSAREELEALESSLDAERNIESITCLNMPDPSSSL